MQRGSQPASGGSKSLVVRVNSNVRWGLLAILCSEKDEEVKGREAPVKRQVLRQLDLYYRWPKGQQCLKLWTADRSGRSLTQGAMKTRSQRSFPVSSCLVKRVFMVQYSALKNNHLRVLSEYS